MLCILQFYGTEAMHSYLGRSQPPVCSLSMDLVSVVSTNSTLHDQTSV
jgi:hypothetical protein